jgi:hypothetical protein
MRNRFKLLVADLVSIGEVSAADLDRVTGGEIDRDYSTDAGCGTDAGCQTAGPSGDFCPSPGQAAAMGGTDAACQGTGPSDACSASNTSGCTS